MFTITIQCQDFKEFQDITNKLTGRVPGANVVEARNTFANNKEPGAITMMDKQGIPVPEETKTETKEPAKEVSKKKSKKTEAKEPTPAEAVESQEAEAIDSQGVVTKEEVYAALQKVNTIKGLAVARTILEKFGYQRLSDVTSDKFTEFHKACEQACV